MVAIWMSQEDAARRYREGLQECNARTRPVVSDKISGFRETPSRPACLLGAAARHRPQPALPGIHDATIADLTIPGSEQILICRPGLPPE
jgi:hypothetical protein